MIAAPLIENESDRERLRQWLAATLAKIRHDAQRELSSRKNAAVEHGAIVALMGVASVAVGSSEP